MKKFESAKLGWESSAVSHNSMSPNPSAVQGFECTAPATGTQAIIGLSELHQASDTTSLFSEVDHALFFGTDGGVSVWERGSLIGDFGTCDPGQTVSIVVNQNEVEYHVGDQLRYASLLPPAQTLMANAFIMNPGGEVRDFTWVSQEDSATDNDPAPGVPIRFRRFRGLVAPDTSTFGKLTKIPGRAAGWDSAAVSFGGINSQSVARGVSFKPESVDRRFVIGLLGDDQPQVSYMGVDFGAVCMENGDFQVYEQGEYKGTFGTYVSNERIVVKEEQGRVKYFVNGDLRYTSLHALTPGSSVNAAFYDPDTSVGDIHWE